MKSASIPENLYSQITHQMMCGSTQGSVLSLGVSCDSNFLFSGVWRCKGWLAVPAKDLSSEVE